MTGERSIYVLGFVICILTYQIWPYTPRPWHVFYKGLAVSWCVIALYEVLRTSDKNSFEKLPLLIFIATLNNAMDEMFFDPTKFGINEAVTGIVLLAMACMPSKRIAWRRNRHPTR